MGGGGVGQEAQDGERRHRLAGARLADQRHGLGLADVEGDVLDGMGGLAAAMKIDGEVVDADERFPGGRRRHRALGLLRSAMNILMGAPLGGGIGAFAVLDLDRRVIEAEARMQALLDGLHHAGPGNPLSPRRHAASPCGAPG